MNLSRQQPAEPMSSTVSPTPAKLGVSGFQAVMVGDKPYDAEAASEAGPAAAGVLTGGFSIDSLREAGCFAVADEISGCSVPCDTRSRHGLEQEHTERRAIGNHLFPHLSPEVVMYHHVKKLMYTVRVDEPDPRFGNMLLEQFGGANGELAAAMQYSIQGLNCEDPDRKDLLMDIGTEELSHLEVVGSLARLHLKPMKFDRQKAEADPLIAIAGGGGVNLFNSQGHAWTADYLKITGELDVDLRSNIAAEARAKIVYERLINFCDDAGTKDALQFLMTREITHMKAFSAALESMKKPAFSIGKIAPTPGLVNQFFNDSTGSGDEGEIDTRGPWNEGGDWEFMSSPALSTTQPTDALIRTESSPPTAPEGINELLLDELRDILHAEKQLTKALPKMAKAARFDRLRECFEEHLIETEAQIERLNECFSLLGETARAKPCKGMMGLVEEGQEVMAEGEKKEDAVADLALIGAAQRVEHYEISGYTTAKNLAQQLRHSAVVSLLSKSLAKEENADQLLNQVARTLMSVAKMPEAMEQTTEEVE
jgi:Mn-containing catalase